MRRTVAVLLVTLLLCVGVKSHAASTVELVQFYSESLDESRWVKVYLPDGYDPGGSTRYPVIYFLHGFHAIGYDIYWNYINLQAMLDNLIALQTIRPIILVTPDGREAPWSCAWWTNSELYGQFEDYVVEDVIEFVDMNYRTLPTPACRVLMGHSMGGYGAMKIALKHQEVYRAVVSSSGVVGTVMSAPQDSAEVIAEARNHGWPTPPYEYHPSSGEGTFINFAKCGAWSPNLAGSPYPVDFFLDEWGLIIESVMARWRLNDPPYLASQVQQSPAMSVYFECGTLQAPDAEWKLHEQNTAFADSLDDLGWEYQFRVYEGADHFWSCATRFPDDFAFINSLLCQSEAVADRGNGGWSAKLLFDPNPAYGFTDVTFALPADDRVSLVIYDIQGRLVRRLLDDQMPAGQHHCRWAGRDDKGAPVAKGVYFLSLSSERGMHAQKRVVMVR